MRSDRRGDGVYQPTKLEQRRTSGLVVFGLGDGCGGVEDGGQAAVRDGGRLVAEAGPQPVRIPVPPRKIVGKLLLGHAWVPGLRPEVFEERGGVTPDGFSESVDHKL
ncbi:MULTISPECIES: hypothetical protein [Streptomyces]|uniref:hypothetical protein n=1 Tax=Streptomyces TaxID=1883 RepID=UPI00345C124C